MLSARSIIYSPRRGYLSPGNYIVLEIETALLFISVTNSCRFWGSFVEIQACFQHKAIYFRVSSSYFPVRLLNDMRI